VYGEGMMNAQTRPELLRDDAGSAGEARCPGITAQEILAADRVPPPAILTQQSYTFLGDEDIAASRYTSQEFFNREMERMWRRTWQWACREEHIPESGDYYVYEIGDHSVIIVRTESGDVKAYYNVCQHRGTKLRSHTGVGHAAEIRCPFHGWSWNLDGTLKNIPCAWDFPHVAKRKFGLAEVKVGIWGGFVFINLDANAADLQEYLRPLPEHFRNWDLSRRRITLHIEKELPCNWKAAVEAFVEGYHILETHPQLLATIGDANTQYDIYGDNVSRFIELAGVPSPHVEPVSPKEMLAQMMVGVTSSNDDEIELQEGDTARSVMAAQLRKVLGQKYGADLSGYSDSEMIDPVQYSLFPNMFLFPGIGFPMIYRVRPAGISADRCIFEILFLQPPTAGAAPAEPPEPVKVAENDSLLTVPGFEPGLATALDQDTGNLRAQHLGYKFVNKGLTLGNYQEIRIRQLHRTLDKYLAAD
jgi:phenylpropionate dioxygenase-like ring-hydroxylating dioxygenase large terminal subunit